MRKDATIQRGATIRDVLRTLNDRENFLRGIIGSFVAGSYDKAQAVVRIGTSGKGYSPNYCIEEGDEVFEGPAGIPMHAFTKREVFSSRSYDHKKILEDDFKGEDWGKPMKYAEIVELLGEVLREKRA